MADTEHPRGEDLNAACYAHIRARGDALAAELHRRLNRLEELLEGPDRRENVVEHVRGETVALRLALGIATGIGDQSHDFSVHVGENYYRDWLTRQARRYAHR